MKKETSMYICRLKNQLRQVFPQYLPIFSRVNGKASLAVLSHFPSPNTVSAMTLRYYVKGRETISKAVAVVDRAYSS